MVQRNFQLRHMEEINEENKELRGQVTILTSKVEELKKTEKEPEAPSGPLLAEFRAHIK